MPVKVSVLLDKAAASPSTPAHKWTLGTDVAAGLARAGLVYLTSEIAATAMRAFTAPVVATINAFMEVERARLRAMFEVWVSDFHLAQNADTPEERHAATVRLCEQIKWSPGSDSKVSSALLAHARDQQKDTATVKRELLLAAIPVVLAESKRPQVHRFGRDWVTRDDGRRDFFVPAELPLANPFECKYCFWHWFEDETIKAAEAWLQNQSYPPVSGEAFSRSGIQSLTNIERESPLLHDTTIDPIEVLLASEQKHEDSHALRGLLASAKPAEVALLMVLLDQLNDRPHPDFAEADRTLGLKSGTARVRWHRFRRELRRAM